MNPFILTLRAVGAGLAQKLLFPIMIIIGIWFVLFFGLAFWLTTIGEWWWLLLIPLTSLLCVTLAVGFVVFSLIRYVRPAQNKEQKQAVEQFIAKLQGVTDITSTPKFLILFRVVRSIASPTKDTYLADVVNNKKLVGDFRELQRLFDTRVIK